MILAFVGTGHYRGHLCFTNTSCYSLFFMNVCFDLERRREKERNLQVQLIKHRYKIMKYLIHACELGTVKVIDFEIWDRQTIGKLGAEIHPYPLNLFLLVNKGLIKTKVMLSLFSIFNRADFTPPPLLLILVK